MLINMYIRFQSKRCFESAVCESIAMHAVHAIICRINYKSVLSMAVYLFHLQYDETVEDFESPDFEEYINTASWGPVLIPQSKHVEALYPIS